MTPGAEREPYKPLQDAAKRCEDILLKEMHYDENGLQFGLSGDATKHFYCSLVSLFRSCGGENFLTTTVSYKLSKYEITIVNLNGKDSPAEKLQRQAEEIAALKKELEELKQQPARKGEE
jgi:hypothetical protein